jgi:hypothetical protein
MSTEFKSCLSAIAGLTLCCAPSFAADVAAPSVWSAMIGYRALYVDFEKGGQYAL